MVKAVVILLSSLLWTVSGSVVDVGHGLFSPSFNSHFRDEEEGGKYWSCLDDFHSKPVALHYVVETTEKVSTLAASSLFNLIFNVAEFSTADVTTSVAITTFRDKPIAPYGAPGDYCSANELPSTIQLGEVLNWCKAHIHMSKFGGGGDDNNSQLDALHRASLKVHLGSDVLSVVVLISATEPHAKGPAGLPLPPTWEDSPCETHRYSSVDQVDDVLKRTQACGLVVLTPLEHVERYRVYLNNNLEAESVVGEWKDNAFDSAANLKAALNKLVCECARQRTTTPRPSTTTTTTYTSTLTSTVTSTATARTRAPQHPPSSSKDTTTTMCTSTRTSTQAPPSSSFRRTD